MAGALSSSCPPLGRAGLCVQALPSCCPSLGRAPELCQLCGWAVCPGLVLLNSVNSVAGLCVQALSPLVLLLAAPLNSVNSMAGLCGWALCPGLVLLLSSSSRPCPSLGRAPELSQPCGWAVWLAPELCQLCGWALCPGLLAPPGFVSRPCPPVVLLLAVPLNSVNSVAGLCDWALWRARALKRERQRKINLKRKRERERAGQAHALVCYGRLTGLLSSSCPLCWALWLGLVLFLSSSCPCLGRAPELWLGSVAGPAYWRGVWPNK